METRTDSTASRPDWGPLEEALDALAERADGASSPETFYTQAAELLLDALGAEGVVVFTDGSELLAVGSLQSEGEVQQIADEGLRSGGLVRRHVAGGECLATPVADLVDERGACHAVICVVLHEEMAEAGRGAAEELLGAVAQRATDYHASRELRRLRGNGADLASLVSRLHTPVGLRAVAFEAVNEAQRLLGFDRVALVVLGAGRRPLLAISGVDRIEQRGEAARGLTELAQRVAAWGEPVDYRDQSEQDELAPEVHAALVAHLDASHARSLAAVPVELRSPGDEAARGKRTAVFIGESFTPEGESDHLQPLVELATVCEPALASACRLESPLVRVSLAVHEGCDAALERLGLGRLALGVLAAACCVAALVLVRVDFEIEAPATLRPVVERHVFAGEDGVVEEVLVRHGETVEPGQVLARLRDPELAVQLQTVKGEAETTRRRLEAIAVSRTDRRVREQPDDDGMPLGAETLQLSERLASLERQQAILESRLAGLEATSPIAGRVLDLDVQQQLRLRPVERGEVLLTVADPLSGWRLEVELPQDRAGYVASAALASESPLPVRYRLAGDASQTHRGVLEEISESVPLDMAGPDDPAPPVKAVVRAEGVVPEAARPGMDATVRIHCGRCSVGFVWLHEAWETVYRWVTF